MALRRGLVVATVAIALMLLVGAGLLIKSFTRLVGVDPGFRPDHLLTFNMALPRARYSNDTLRVAFFNRAVEAISAVPGVVAVGATQVLPFSNNWSTSSFNVEGLVVGKGENNPWGDQRTVTPGYLGAMGIQLLKGRQFTQQDDDKSPAVAIVDEETVRQYWPDQDPIGKRITYDEPTDSVVRWIHVVGEVRHTMHEGLDAEKRVQIYIPMQQDPNAVMTFAVRTSGDPVGAVPGIRAALKEVDGDVAMAGINPMDELIAVSTGPRRFSMVLLAVFSILAAALAAIGLYGRHVVHGDAARQGAWCPAGTRCHACWRAAAGHGPGCATGGHRRRRGTRRRIPADQPAARLRQRSDDQAIGTAAFRGECE